MINTATHFPGRQFVLPTLQIRQSRGAFEFGDHDGVLHVRSLLRFLHVVVDVHEMPELDADFDDVEAHGDDVFGGRAVVARAHVVLEGRVEVAARVVEVAQVVVPHADALLDQVRLREGKTAKKTYQIPEDDREDLLHLLDLALHARGRIGFVSGRSRGCVGFVS